ncbi:MAG: Uncharacterized protein Athens071426_80 [Parcubacteria group bacterium Athens0714_26]|nr:MAG: Uncharacterized protein Athens071426_80 [Parcubacteria group bacterium Athens0714_26]
MLNRLPVKPLQIWYFKYMKRVPRKNISRIVADVKPPDFDKTEKYSFFNFKKQIVGENKKIVRKRKKSKPTPIINKSIWATLLILIAVLSVYSFDIFNFKNNALGAFQYIYNEAVKTKLAASRLQTESAAESLKSINKEIGDIKNEADKSGFSGLTYLLGGLIPAVKEIPKALDNFYILSQKTLEIAQDINYLKANSIDLVLNKKGNELTGALERINQNISAIENLNSEINTQSRKLASLTPQMASFSNVIQKNYFDVSSGLYKTRNFIAAALSILKSPENQHFLLLFQNPSEIRPSGGFLGSFGDISLSQGSLKEIKVDDIYNADRQLNLKIIPPAELQGITTKWGARDANWFFDFPASAQKVSYMLENSELFSKDSVKFQGPIELPTYRLTISEKNFLETVQREVEAGQDKKPGQNPKRILSALAPIIMEKLRGISPEQKNEFISKLAGHLKQKDIMIYANNPDLENLITDSGIAGNVYSLPDNFNGDYMAVVNANIAGGKADAVISQQITLKSKILNDGNVINDLTITRIYDNQNKSDWWYNATDKNYIKILTPPDATLTAFTGNDKPPAKSNFNYSKNGYLNDIDLQAIEQTAIFSDKFQNWIGQESGKKFFGAWFSLPKNKTKTLKATYELGGNLDMSDGKHYQFIFEKQSGVESSLEYAVTAPDGYIWKESGKPIFEFNSQQLNAREIIDLTIQRQ